MYPSGRELLPEGIYKVLQRRGFYVSYETVLHDIPGVPHNIYEYVHRWLFAMAGFRIVGAGRPTDTEQHIVNSILRGEWRERK